MDCSRHSRAANSVRGLSRPNFEPIPDFMVVLVTYKCEEDLIENEGAKVVTKLFIEFSDAQWQLTPISVMESFLNSNLAKMLWLFLLPSLMKKIHLKMKALEWSQHFSHYKSIGMFLEAQGLLTPHSLVRSCQILNQSDI